MYNWKNIRFKKTMITLYITFALLAAMLIMRNVSGGMKDITPTDTITFLIGGAAISAVSLIIPYIILKCNPEKDYTYKDLLMPSGLLGSNFVAVLMHILFVG